MNMKKCCDMRGFLSFLVLRLIKKESMSGEQIRCEIEKRKGHKPSPGTIYPVLKSLSENGWIKESKVDKKEKSYELTEDGKRELKDATKKFLAIFCDMKDDFNRINS